MIYKATQEIYEALTADNLKASTQKLGGCSMVMVQFSLSCSAPAEIRFMSTDDDNDVAVRVDLMRVDADKAEAILPVINSFNVQYRYAKFTLNSENDVFVEYDFPVREENVGECAKEMVARFLRIVRDVHPQLLRAALPEEPEEPAGVLS